MARLVALLALAHGRSGDKGDAVNIGVIARRPEWYPLLREELSAEKVRRFLGSMAEGPVERHELPNLEALNFIVHGALGGGGSAGLQLDAQGKTYAHALLRLPVELSEEQYVEVSQHWKGDLPDECLEAAPSDGSGRERLVRYERDGRLATILLDAPRRHNALSLETMRQARDAAAQAAADPRVKVVLLAGSGPSFCAGLNLRELGENRSFEKMKIAARTLASGLLQLLAVPQPVVAAVQGAAMGGGTALALAADVIFAHASTAKLGLPEVRIGFVPGLVSTLASRRMTPGAARELMLSGRTIGAGEAHRQGWVHYLVQDESPAATVEAARAYCQELIARNGDLAMRRTKELINAGERPGLERELLAATDVFVANALEDSFRRGMEAFVAREALDWTTD
jgi:methylglutaconyl-CoA hydratase